MSNPASLRPGISANQSLVVKNEHTAPHVGSGVAPVVQVDGRTVRFELNARDEVEPIGKGHHERVVVTISRFDARVKRKAQGARC